MKKDYFSVYKKSSIISDIVVVLIALFFTWLSFEGFLHAIDTDAYVSKYVSVLELIIGGTVCITVSVITASLAGIHIGEFVRKVHINIVNAKHNYK